MSKEKTLEDAYIALVQGIQYIIDNSINVRNFEDNNTTVNPPAVIVNCNSFRRLEPNADYYESEVDFICFTYIQDDKARAQLRALQGEIFDFARSLAPATLATQSGLTIDGLVMDDAGEQERDDHYNFLTVKLKTYLTII
jgi:hypothetical protein